MRGSKVPAIAGEDSQYRTAEPSSDDPRWQLAQRIVASKSFAKSSFLSNFLLYVCDRELRGRAEEITEYQIGVQALGRPANYNPGADNIVRNYARLLRKRLEDYFETTGKDEPLRLSIPRGRYVPVFHSGVQVEPSSPASNPTAIPNTGNETIPTPFHPADTTRPTLLIPLISLAVLLALIGGYFAAKSFHRTPITQSQQFWTQIFNRNTQTLIVPADSGFGILQNLTRHPIHLGDYVNGTYLSKSGPFPGVDARNLNDLATQRYTSVVDLNITMSLSRLPEVVPDHFAIRYARDLRMEDLKYANAILLGSLHSNPWVELFQKDLNFALEYQPEVDDSIVVNRHPLAGEHSIYKNAWADDSHETYTVLAFVPSLDGMGHVILMEGLNMAGTQAAADFLLNERAMSPILKKAQQPDGTLEPFELLLETNSIGANAPEARIIAERYGAGQMPPPPQ